MTDLSVFDNDPTLYLYTSLTAGSSHIITATSRIETILKANRLPYTKVDTATNELARKLYGRRASGKKLPLLVKEGFVLGDLEQVEEWNEFGELKEAIGPVPGAGGGPKPPIKTMGGPAKPAAVQASAAAATEAGAKAKENAAPEAKKEDEATLALRQAGAEAASIGKSKQDEKKAALLSGFGKATEAKTVEEPKDAAGETPAEAEKPAETEKLAQTEKPAQTESPADTKEAADEEKLSDPKKPTETTSSATAEKPTEKDDWAEKEAAKEAIQSEAPSTKAMEEPVESYENLQKLSETTEHHRESTAGVSSEEKQDKKDEEAPSKPETKPEAKVKADSSASNPADGDAEKNPAGALEEVEPRSTKPETVDEGKTKALEEKRDVEDTEGRKNESQGKALDSAKKASKDEEEDDDEGEDEEDDEDEDEEDEDEDEDEHEHEEVKPTEAEMTKADTERVESSKANTEKAEPAKAATEGIGTKVKDSEPAKAEKASDSVED